MNYSTYKNKMLCEKPIVRRAYKKLSLYYNIIRIKLKMMDITSSLKK